MISSLVLFIGHINLASKILSKENKSFDKIVNYAGENWTGQKKTILSDGNLDFLSLLDIRKLWLMINYSLWRANQNYLKVHLSLFSINSKKYIHIWRYQKYPPSQYHSQWGAVSISIFHLSHFIFYRYFCFLEFLSRIDSSNIINFGHWNKKFTDPCFEPRGREKIFWAKYFTKEIKFSEAWAGS